jgi:AmmeMemoRadiSam system protein A
MLICAGLSPHPPIIIPDIGGDELQKVKSTTAAMREWASSIAEQSPQVLVFISSHGIFLRRQLGYLRTPEICGDFAAFGAPQVSFQVENDLELARRIAREAEQEGVETVGVDMDNWYVHDPGSLDHGITVPLYYLEQAGVEAAVVAFGISMLPRQRLFGFGQALGRVLQRSPRRIALIASGDLSHRLQPGAPAGYSPRGREFDRIIKESLEQMDAERILNIADDLAEDAGECGLRPIIMLMGALDNFEAEPKIYSYEGPFGVGYLVAGFRIGGSAHTQLARRSLEYYLRTGEIMPVPQPVPEGMEERAGVFVSLKKSGRLRGCIGTFEPSRKNIASEIIHNAVAAGVEDPRFWPVELSELPEIDFSVDVLTPPAPVSSRDELDAKRYGVIVKSGRKTGLLLPDLEGVDSVDQQIGIACQKAGISPGDEAELFRFEVIRYR